jgi:hypothetical protein
MVYKIITFSSFLKTNFFISIIITIKNRKTPVQSSLSLSQPSVTFCSLFCSLDGYSIFEVAVSVETGAANF